MSVSTEAPPAPTADSELRRRADAAVRAIRSTPCDPYVMLSYVVWPSARLLAASGGEPDR